MGIIMGPNMIYKISVLHSSGWQKLLSLIKLTFKRSPLGMITDGTSLSQHASVLIHFFPTTEALLRGDKDAKDSHYRAHGRTFYQTSGFQPACYYEACDENR